MHQLHVKRYERVPRIAHQKYDLCPRQLARRHEIFSTNSLPKARLHPLLREVVGENHSGNIRFVITVRPQRERPAGTLAKICAEKSADPGAAAFRHGNNDRVTAGKLARATAQVPTAKTSTPARI